MIGRRLSTRRRALILLRGALVLLLSLLRLALTLLHRGAMRAHLLLELVLLIARQHAHDLAAQLAPRVGIHGAAFRMRLRILVDHRLDTLLLIVREIEMRESPLPTMLHSVVTRLNGSALRLRGIL